ncbi:MAG: CDGSH iron-sulfur domain-containing protein [Pseudomonadota bacterium]
MPKIEPQADGPLLVTGEPDILYQDGTALPPKPVTALCRCGASKSKPYCDGSHVAAGFLSDSDNGALRKTPFSYTGKVDGQDVTVSYTPVLCSHAAECQKAASKMFDPARKPWVDVAEGDMSDVLSAVGNCPSGALSLQIGSLPGAMHMTDGNVDIQIEKNGPYRVRNISIESEFSTAGSSPSKYVLCRCGKSKNKPFCDGTHYDEKWTDDAT